MTTLTVAPLSDADIKERIAMVDHLDMQAQAMHGNLAPVYRWVLGIAWMLIIAAMLVAAWLT